MDRDIGSRGGSKVQPGLTKPEVQRLRRAEAMLRDYQDEKLDIYTKQIDDMAVVYEKARQVRQRQQAEYEARQQQVMTELDNMRTRTDKEAKEQHDRLKKFSADFEVGVAKGKSEWKEQFFTAQAKLNKANDSLREELKTLTAALDKEREECRTHSQNQTGPILEKLAQHREYLETQVIKERGVGNVEYTRILEEHFDDLGEQLSSETSSRDKQSTEARAAAAKRFLELGEKQLEANEQMQKQLLERRQRLAQEKAERTQAQDIVTSNMLSFMKQFEKNIVDNQQNQKASQKLLLEMKEAMSTQ